MMLGTRWRKCLNDLLVARAIIATEDAMMTPPQGRHVGG